MSTAAPRSSPWPLGKLAAIYAVSVPLALMITPAGLSWDTVAAVCAMGLGWMAGLAPWWLVINALFLPALAWTLTLELSPLWALAGLVMLVLVYGRIWSSRVPLFFSSARAQAALIGLLPAGAQSFLDVGCGDGRVLVRLAAGRPDSRFTGVEQALVPWMLARLRCWASGGRCAVERGDLWKHDLASYDVVYAYLSPAVMPEFWKKAQSEMRPGALLVSAFAVPQATASRCIEIDDAVGTRLHVWRIGAGTRRCPT